MLRTVQRLADSVVEDGLESAVLDLGCEVRAHVLFIHPAEHGRPGPIAAQAALDEVLALYRAALDEPAHRRAVAGQVPLHIRCGVGVCVEVDDAHVAVAVMLGQRGDVGPGDAVVTAQDDRDDAGPHHVPDEAHNVREATLCATPYDLPVPLT